MFGSPGVPFVIADVFFQLEAELRVDGHVLQFQLTTFRDDGLGDSSTDGFGFKFGSWAGQSGVLVVVGVDEVVVFVEQ